jgi:hypothetical protein
MNLPLIADVVARLRSYAVIGAYALAARGYVRQTRDFDLMTTDRAALDASIWNDLSTRGLRAEVRKGDTDDPLAGVVRFSGTMAIDIVVGKYRWQQEVIDRAEPMRFDDTTLMVPRTPDLIVLKLFAGGLGDAHDVIRLLDIGPRDTLIGEVNALLAPLPEEMRLRWQKIVG